MPYPTPTRVDAAGVRLDADVVVPPDARGLVAFAHGSGSSRQSPRNRMVAGRLNGVGLATVLTDLLTPAEDAHGGDLRFDVGLLGRRLRAVVDWAGTQPDLAALPLGLFGASTGAAAALLAAAGRPDRVRAVVSRGGRPDLAGEAARSVTAPTLLVVGALDTPVLALNKAVAPRFGGPVAVHVVPGATHLFAEPGTLEAVVGAAAEWFDRYLTDGDLTLDGYLPAGGGSGR
ncbi:dienelactone hydrolase family protein [Dactylosporangium roseum]|uniref:Dienelactone hydrolase family protein n=1 Tax=Dactylosporangium roseum TaxID=47989 RepID=A0ABY5ZDR8_9ACTN|nr:dienelactone hydrolase family protein [Dactylosporangium roseum]UWZ40022.1 dienelactone hydrolase family protein [Dactylosporangium roseum]